MLNLDLVTARKVEILFFGHLSFSVESQTEGNSGPSTTQTLCLHVFPIQHFAGNGQCGGSNQVAVEQVRIPYE